MILTASLRTDVVQYYPDWLLRRFAEGYVLVRNPQFPNKVSRYALTPDKIDCVVLCSKNYAPILPRLREITARFPVYCYYTITAYGRDIEPGVPDVQASIETLHRLAALVGLRRVAWRYDPVLLTERYTVPRHLEAFEAMAARLAGRTDRCIFSFVELYHKVQHNMPGLRPVPPAQREELARGFGQIAAQYGIPIQTCGTDADYSRWGVGPSGCITLDILGRANGLDFRPHQHKGTRPGCHCIDSRDLGAYDTCPNGCLYCYANASPALARENFARHDPASPLLLGCLGPGDIVQQAAQGGLMRR